MALTALENSTKILIGRKEIGTKMHQNPVKEWL